MQLVLRPDHVKKSDDERFGYLVSIRWYLLISGVIGCGVVLAIYGVERNIIAAGLLLGFSGVTLVIASISGYRPSLLVLVATLFLLSAWLMPSYGREFRGQMLAYQFFFALPSFSSVLILRRWFWSG